jgi:hypothetical protein
MPVFLYPENLLISSLNDYCKRKETPENGYHKSAGLTALQQAQLFRNSFDKGHRLGAVPNTCARHMNVTGTEQTHKG